MMLPVHGGWPGGVGIRLGSPPHRAWLVAALRLVHGLGFMQWEGRGVVLGARRPHPSCLAAAGLFAPGLGGMCPGVHGA